MTLICILAAVAAACGPQAARAQDPNGAAPARPTGEQWQKMTPEERQARLKQLREVRGERPASLREEATKLKQELRDLSPAEREARINEFREKHGLPAPNPEMQKRREELMKLPPEERRAKIEELRRSRPAPPAVDDKTRQERRAALQKKLAELSAKKADGKLSAEEEKQLEHLERASKLMREHPLSDPAAPAPAEKN